MTETILASVGITFLSGFLIYTGIAMLHSSLWFILLVLLGLIPLSLAILFSSGVKSSEYWINVVKNKSGNIIWIKPISVKHTVGLIITLYNENKFQLLTIDGKNLTINCTSEEAKRDFFEGIKKHLPHAHIGYSPQILELYYADRINFISILQKNNAYTPVRAFDL